MNFQIFAILIVLLLSIPISAAFAQEQEGKKQSDVQEESNFLSSDTIRRPETIDLSQDSINLHWPTQVPVVTGAPMPRMDFLSIEEEATDERRAE